VLPSASCALTPKMRCAAGFHRMILPSGAAAMIASRETARVGAERGDQSPLRVSRRRSAQPATAMRASWVDRAYFGVHTPAMRSVRRTISMPASLAARLDREARRRGKSFSALIAELAEHKPEPLPYAGLIEDDPDLSLRVEQVLSRVGD